MVDKTLEGMVSGLTNDELQGLHSLILSEATMRIGPLTKIFDEQKRMGNAPMEKLYKEVEGDIKDGRKVSAIKHVRKETGLGLKEAKDIVDAWQEEIFGDPTPVSTPAFEQRV